MLPAGWQRGSRLKALNYTEMTYLVTVVLAGVIGWMFLQRRQVLPMDSESQQNAPELQPNPVALQTEVKQARTQAQERLEKMAGATIRLKGVPQPIAQPAHAETGEQMLGTRSMQGRWLRICLEVTVPHEGTEWWPLGLNVDSPQLAQQRNAATDVSLDDLATLVGLFIECHLEDPSLNDKSLRGSGQVNLVAYFPEAFRDYQICYYGLEMLRLEL